MSLDCLFVNHRGMGIDSSSREVILTISRKSSTSGEVVGCS